MTASTAISPVITGIKPSPGVVSDHAARSPRQAVENSSGGKVPINATRFSPETHVPSDIGPCLVECNPVITLSGSGTRERVVVKLQQREIDLLGPPLIDQLGDRATFECDQSSSHQRVAIERRGETWRLAVSRKHAATAAPSPRHRALIHHGRRGNGLRRASRERSPSDLRPVWQKQSRARAPRAPVQRLPPI